MHPLFGGVELHRVRNVSGLSRPHSKFAGMQDVIELVPTCAASHYLIGLGGQMAVNVY